MKKLLTIVLLLGCTVGPVVAIFVYESARTRSITVEILARAPERGNFLPRKVVLRVGEKATLRVRNVDCVTHGFSIPGLNIAGGDIKAGHYALFEITPTKIGQYDFYCTAWCSDHHLQMRGVIDVVAK
ncbi:hypothetical protein LCGC14_1961200 [marine sediment metagenome]|uniref:EfeO-type cupredoxin-like domain-containing protein n=1 Tax=marine sediment metagenome TaxID=412755 RepID=A0A0F9HSY3_9ZZZZ